MCETVTTFAESLPTPHTLFFCEQFQEKHRKEKVEKKAKKVTENHLCLVLK